MGIFEVRMSFKGFAWLSTVWLTADLGSVVEAPCMIFIMTRYTQMITICCQFVQFTVPKEDISKSLQVDKVNSAYLLYRYSE